MKVGEWLEGMGLASGSGNEKTAGGPEETIAESSSAIQEGMDTGKEEIAGSPSAGQEGMDGASSVLSLYHRSEDIYDREREGLYDCLASLNLKLPLYPLYARQDSTELIPEFPFFPSPDRFPTPSNSELAPAVESPLVFPHNENPDGASAATPAVDSMVPDFNIHVDESAKVVPQLDPLDELDFGIAFGESTGDSEATMFRIIHPENLDPQADSETPTADFDIDFKIQEGGDELAIDFNIDLDREPEPERNVQEPEVVTTPLSNSEDIAVDFNIFYPDLGSFVVDFNITEPPQSDLEIDFNITEQENEAAPQPELEIDFNIHASRSPSPNSTNDEDRIRSIQALYARYDDMYDHLVELSVLEHLAAQQVALIESIIATGNLLLE